MSDFKIGETVKVTIEGTVSHAEFDDDWIVVNGHDVLTTEDNVTIERIKPPVIHFKPGDIVRGQTGGLFSLGKEGFLSHRTGAFIAYGQGGLYRTLEGFTSEAGFEKVEL